MASNYVLGVELLRKKLLELPKAAAVELQASMNASGEELMALQKSRVHSSSGATADSIRMEPFSRGGIGVIIRAGGPTTTKPVKNGKSPRYDYALAQELGTQEMLAQPFFYPSYRQLKSKIKRNATAAVVKAVATIGGAP